MALRKSMLLLPCVTLMTCVTSIGAEEAEPYKSTAVEQEQQEELSLIDQIRQMLDEESRKELDALLNDVQGISQQLQQVQPELESKHGKIVAQLKELLGTDQIPFNLTLVLGDAQQQLDQQNSE